MTGGATDGGAPSVRIPKPLPEGVDQATIGVRGGLLRSGFEETSEAIFLNSGYVYESAGQAEKAFTGRSTATSTPATATPPFRCSRNA